MQDYGGQMLFLTALPEWAAYLVPILAATWTVCMAGVALGKTGRNPLWALLGFFPYVLTLGLWIVAFTRWPRQAVPAAPDAASDAGRDGDQDTGRD